MSKVWWVNQKGDDGSVLWAGAEDARGRRVWHWDTMWDVEPGDVVFHYLGQKIIGVSSVRNKARRETFPWPRSNPRRRGEKGKRIDLERYPVDPPIERDLISLAVRQRASKKQGPFWESGSSAQQGYLFPVGQELLTELLMVAPHLRALPPFVNSGLLDPIDIEGSTDFEVIALARREQAQLRDMLLGGAVEGACGICGQVLPSEYLWAAHIKRRAEASEEERRDPNIVMLACLLGCDQAFECGDIFVSDRGTIRLRDSNDPFLSSTFGHLQGQVAPAFNSHTAQYFAARGRVV